MLLAIDAGNTRTKWAVFDAASTMLDVGICLNTALHQTPLPKASKAIISNVAGDQHAALLASKLVALAIPTHWVKATAHACGVTNTYDHPSQLGVDRWAALIAVRHHIKQAVLVVSAGTTITMDALDSRGAFFGGTIMPGLHLMQASLMNNTAQLKAGEGKMDDFPRNTQDAIQTGCLNAVAGAVGLMLKRLEKHSGWLPKLVISGGDASKIVEALKPELKQVMIMEHLVLQGLVLLTKE